MPWTKPYESRYLKIDPAKRRFLVHRRTFNDPAVFEEEKERILLKSWMYLGHESELRKKNDFLVREILDKEILFTRDKQDKIHAFYNTCTHRGVVLCRDKAGNRPVFSCPYHGWAFRTNGDLMTRNADQGYPDDVDAEGLYNLKPVPRLEHRSGFYFLNFDEDAISLDEFLGDAGDRIDMLAQHSPNGIEVIGVPHEYSINGNYKLMAENSIDGYHLLPTHGSYFAYQKSMLEGIEQRIPGGAAISLTHGHATVQTDVQAGRPVAQWLPVWGEKARGLIEEQGRELEARLGKERADVIAQTHRLMTIFPNTVMNDQQSIQVRSVQPVSHDKMVTRAWLFGVIGEDPELRRVRIEGALSFLGPGGFATPDDIEMLELAQKGYQMGGVEYNDLSKGFRPEEDTLRDTDWWANELHLRCYWVQYDKMMSGEPVEARMPTPIRAVA